MSPRAWMWRHPEWWALALSAAAWVPLARGGSAHHHHGMAMRREGLGTFALMVVAMMLPATIGSIRTTAARSLWRRRGRAVAEHVAAFVAVWLAAGAAFLWIRGLLGLEAGGVAAVVAFGLAAGWQLTPLKRRALAAHHRTRPLAPRGLRADRDCLAYGGAAGLRCVLTCGPLMAAMSLAAHSLFVMVLGTSVVMAERYRFRPPRRTTAAAIGAIAAAFAVS